MLYKSVKYHDLQLIDYKEAWDYQDTIHKELVNQKLKTRNGKPNQSLPFSHLILCEHPHVFTLGRSGKQNNLLIQDDFLKQIGASYFITDRGGDITYHGPGQIVGYPIFDLDQFGYSAKKYIYSLEEAIILTLKEFAIHSSRLKGATGVWLDADKPELVRKICAIGVRISRSITMHGFALNINTNLKYFNYIHPCGFVDKGVTSLQKELGSEQDIEQVKDILKSHLSSIFKIDLQD